LEAGDDGKKSLYNTEVWVKPWESHWSSSVKLKIQSLSLPLLLMVTLRKGIFGLGRFDNIHSSEM
jgi:hypothetical protein